MLALVGGVAAVLIANYSNRFVHGDWIPTTLWPQALIWAVIGGGLLAVRELLVRAGAMSTELEGVI